jgi:hypothetical protein
MCVCVCVCVYVRDNVCHFKEAFLIKQSHATGENKKGYEQKNKYCMAEDSSIYKNRDN